MPNETSEPPDTVTVNDRTFVIEHVPDNMGGVLYACGILSMQFSRAALIENIKRAQGQEWRR